MGLATLNHMMNKESLLHHMGITRWQLRDKSSSSAPAAVVPAEDWAQLQAQVRDCHLCDLCESRTQTVFGVGNLNAKLIIIGEAPGHHEDQQGEPFVGRAGLLLNAMLQSIGLAREAVYIANVLKCRPPNNRDPRPEEVLKCTAYLRQQLALLQPKCILAVGRIAAHYLLDVDTPLGKMRGQEYTYADTQIPLLVTYHPAYLLRSPREKRKAYLDLQHVKAVIER